MTRMLACCAALGVALTAAASEPAGFSTPPSADEVLEVRDLPFALRYGSDQWAVTPQRSKFRLLARVTHREHPISGVFVYRGEPASEQAIRRRAREELESAFASHEVVDFGPRVVNGAQMLLFKAHATTGDGGEFVVRTYYWNGPEGVADYSLVASREVFAGHRDAIMDLLNGLEIAEAAAAR